MNYAKNITGLILLISMWGACKKAELPPGVIDDPLFEVQFETPGTDDNVKTAGVDGIYLFTDYRIADQQVVCSGSFAAADCPAADCPGTLTFEFKSAFIDQFAPDTVFHTGGYQFLYQDSSAGTSVLRTTFNAVNTSGYSNFSWRIDDEDKGTGPQIVVDYPNISVTPKYVEVMAQRPSGLQSMLGRQVSLTNPGSNPFGSVNINIFSDSLGYQLVAETAGAPYDTLFWNTFDSDSIIFQDSLLSFYSVLMIDSNGNSAAASLAALTPNETFPVHTADFTYSVETIFIPLPSGEVAIQWIDAEGRAWRSDAGIQESTAFFVVTESTPYEKNEKGDDTRKMQVSFECRLFDANGEARDFFGSGVIAVAYPE